MTARSPLLAALAFCLFTTAAMAGGNDRVITLGGAVTEIAVALGAEARIVARDSTSTYPASVLELPDVGYVRALSAENVLALDPGLVIAEDTAGPPEAVAVLAASGIRFITLPEVTGPADIPHRIEAVAAAMDLAPEGVVLAAHVSAGLAEAEARAATVTAPKRVLFILSLQGGRVMAGGEGTKAEAIIRLGGGINAGTGFQGYKPMMDEAVLAAAPDVILMMDREGDLAITDAAVLSHPALAATPAADAGAILRMDGLLLLGFGPRTPEAAKALHDLLYGGKG
jgi:iron complex transport system substrate-binding protein